MYLLIRSNIFAYTVHCTYTAGVVWWWRLWRYLWGHSRVSGWSLGNVSHVHLTGSFLYRSRWKVLISSEYLFTSSTFCPVKRFCVKVWLVFLYLVFAQFISYLLLSSWTMDFLQDWEIHTVWKHWSHAQGMLLRRKESVNNNYYNN